MISINPWVDQIRYMMLDYCKNSGDTWWESHLTSVVEHGKTLADLLSADKEIVEVSGWIHDIVKIRDGIRDQHHVKGAEEARHILTNFHWHKEKVPQVYHCVLTHSSDKNYPPESTEAKVLASADALSHFDNLPAFAHWVYGQDRLGIEEGRQVLLKKYKNNWQKLIPEAQEIGKPKYDAIMLLLGD